MKLPHLLRLPITPPLISNGTKVQTPTAVSVPVVVDAPTALRKGKREVRAPARYRT